MSHAKEYDYIIAGAGCAGLSLAMYIIHSGGFSHKKILLVDKDAKNANDRTWCFWEKDAGLFEPIVHQQWNKLWVHEHNASKKLDIHPYYYKMIRGIDFYDYCFHQINQQPNFTFLQQKVEHVFSSQDTTGIMVAGKPIHADYVFNSILFRQPELDNKEYWLLQHFKGWIIETEENVFNENEATLMDFRTNQKDGTAFCYVLPLAANKALVEYTLFSPQLLQPKEYNDGLASYICNILHINAYKIIDEEFGVIPMTNAPFEPSVNHIINMGTAGGQTKASSGYTFQFIQKQAQAIVANLIKNGEPSYAFEKSRFHFYDSVLLNILYKKKYPGSKIFYRLFAANNTSTVFNFLDNQSSLQQELRIIGSLPTLPFLKAALHQLNPFV